jgi:hypothetical protein
LKYLNITNNICRKYWAKLEIIQYITIAYHALAQDDYTHCHNQAANTVHQELAIKWWLRKGWPMPCYKYEPQSMSENSHYVLHYDRSLITDRTVHNNRPNTVKLDKMITQAYLIDEAIPKSQTSRHLHQEAPPVYRLQRRAHKNAENYSRQITWKFKTACFSLSLYILMQKAVMLNTCHLVWKSLAEKWIRSARSVRTLLFWEVGKPLWSKESGRWWW